MDRGEPLEVCTIPVHGGRVIHSAEVPADVRVGETSREQQMEGPNDFRRPGLTFTALRTEVTSGSGRPSIRAIAPSLHPARAFRVMKSISY
jgi:hypothetical protein